MGIRFGILELADEHSAVLGGVLRAGAIVVSDQAGVMSSFASEVILNADGSIVTSSDIASEREILNAIALHGGERCCVFSEERNKEDNDEQTHNLLTPTWYVDPLDGSSAYAGGSSDYAVMVSEWMGSTPRFSIVSYPSIGDIAVAMENTLEWRAGRDAAFPGPAVSVHLCYLKSSAMRVFADAHAAVLHEEEAESTRALFDVAVGRAEAAVVLLCGHRSWDIAPLLHLVMAAGGRVSDERGRPVTLSGTKVSGRYVIAARNHELHAELATLVEGGL